MGNQQVLRVVSNMPRLGNVHTDRFKVENRLAPAHATWMDIIRLFIDAIRSDVVLIDEDANTLLKICCLRWLWPFVRFKLVAMDINLEAPMGRIQKAKAKVKRLLLRQVDRFIVYFVDLQGFERSYGISAARSCYVPFKVNSWEAIDSKTLSSDGEYVFTGGSSMRDLSTFIAAMRLVEYPGLLLHHGAPLMEVHGTKLDLSDLPPNLRAVRQENDQIWFEFVRNAKIVVIPTLGHSIRPVGISTYLVAMAFRKCVIVTEGVATRGLLRDEAIVVPAGDPAALARAIRLAWEDDQLRERTAAAGRQYAERRAGEDRLYADVIGVCGELVLEMRAAHRNVLKNGTGRRISR